MITSCTKTLSITVRPKRPNAAAGRTNAGVVELVEVPLVREEVVHACAGGSRAAAASGRAGAGRRTTRARCRSARSRRRWRGRVHSALSLGCVVEVARALEGGLEEVLERVRHARDARRRRRRSTSSASGAIAAFIGHSRSAMWCSGPGKPTSVSSVSPVIGFAGSWCARCPLLELARLLDRLAEEHAEHHPERVERGHERGDVARPRRAPCRGRRG